MTATDLCPGLAAMPAERLAPAATALAEAYAEDMSAAPPPEDGFMPETATAYEVGACRT